jgi:hypothetical protein
MSLSSLSRPPLLRLLFLVLLLRPPEWTDVVSEPGLLGGESFTMLPLVTTAVVVETWAGWECVVVGGGVGLLPVIPRLPLLLLLWVLTPVPVAATTVVVVVAGGPVVTAVTTAPLLPRFCLRPFSGFSDDCVLQWNHHTKYLWLVNVHMLYYSWLSYVRNLKPSIFQNQ